MVNNIAKVRWGTDPEAFFAKGKKILGSERFIPENGLPTGAGTIVRDGVQFEMNPTANVSIMGLAQNIGSMFATLDRVLEKNPDVSLCFDGLVEVSRKELDSLSPATRILGCMPSYNFYGSKPINVDPVEYRKRSSGGHIHMGLSTPIFNNRTGDPDERQRLVPACDIFVGLFSILLDRDPGAAERRENYGRAGEYRLPRHGLEYRTTSNYWLRDPVLMSFVFGMAAFAVNMLQSSVSGSDIERELVDCVDIESVALAINTNDYALARRNIETIRPFIVKHMPEAGFPISPRTLDRFLQFTETVNAKGIQRYFPTENISNNWQRRNFESFESFLSRL